MNSLLKKMVPNSVKYIAKRIWHFVNVGGQRYWFDSSLSFKEGMEKNINIFIPDASENDKDEARRDMVWCHRKWLIAPQEYFLFGFYHNKDRNYRKAFLADEAMYMKLIQKEGRDKNKKDLNDKWAFYNLTKEYFGRDVMLLGEKEEFCAFCDRHHEIFIKPVDSIQGRGAHSYKFNSENEIRNLYDEIRLDKGKLLIEELITQSDFMSRWNPSSVNTLRVPSFLWNNYFEMITPVMRMGRKGSIVDNGAQGGVFVAINPQTGDIISDGVDEMGNVYKSHPDSGIEFKGNKVPNWEDLRVLVEKIHKSMPSGHRYIGWDFAQTENGWVLVEGNWGQMLPQIATKEGLKDVFMKYMK